MTPPIDILHVASERVFSAQSAIAATRAMQAGPEASTAYWHALDALELALQDAKAVRELAFRLVEIDNAEPEAIRLALYLGRRKPLDCALR